MLLLQHLHNSVQLRRIPRMLFFLFVNFAVSNTRLFSRFFLCNNKSSLEITIVPSHFLTYSGILDFKIFLGIYIYIYNQKSY